MADQADRQHMLTCEARYWLRRGYTTPEKVTELKESLYKKRGEEAVTRLIEEMRRQWVAVMSGRGGRMSNGMRQEYRSGDSRRWSPASGSTLGGSP